MCNLLGIESMIRSCQHHLGILIYAWSTPTGTHFTKVGNKGWSYDSANQGGGEKRNFSSETTEKTWRKRQIFCWFLFNFPFNRGEIFSLRKLRKSGEREKESAVLFFSSTLLQTKDFGAVRKYIHAGTTRHKDRC